jgi:hypothetical protein
MTALKADIAFVLGTKGMGVAQGEISASNSISRLKVSIAVFPTERVSIIDKALVRNPKDRFPDAGKLLASLSKPAESGRVGTAWPAHRDFRLHEIHN